MICLCHISASVYSPFRPVPPPPSSRPDRVIEKSDSLQNSLKDLQSASDSGEEQTVVTIPSHSLRSSHHKPTLKSETSSPSGKGDARSPQLVSVRLSPGRREYNGSARTSSCSPYKKHHSPGLSASWTKNHSLAIRSAAKVCVTVCRKHPWLLRARETR